MALRPQPTKPLPPEERHPSQLPAARPRILIATGIAVIVTVAQHFLDRGPDGKFAPFFTISPQVFTIMGIAISIFLGFRNNTAYQRFWEARSLWGGLINHSRSLARQTLTLIEPVAPDDTKQWAQVKAYQEDVVMAVISYAHALAHHLHGTKSTKETDELLHKVECEWLRGQDNKPIAILHLIGRRFAWAREQGWVIGVGPLVLENTLTELTNVQGACEKIKNTPVPVTYRLLSRNIVTFFCYLLPLGIVELTQYLTPIVVFLVSYALVGLDYLGEEITDPFGDDPHDLPLETYAKTIESNLRQILSERDLPDVPMPTPEPVLALDR